MMRRRLVRMPGEHHWCQVGDTRCRRTPDITVCGDYSDLPPLSEPLLSHSVCSPGPHYVTGISARDPAAVTESPGLGLFSLAFLLTFLLSSCGQVQLLSSVSLCNLLLRTDLIRAWLFELWLTSSGWMTNASHCLSKLHLIKYFDVMAHVSELGIESIYKVYWMSGGPSHERVSCPPLSLVTNIHPLLLIGQSFHVVTCPGLAMSCCLSNCQFGIWFNSR